MFGREPLPKPVAQHLCTHSWLKMIFQHLHSMYMQMSLFSNKFLHLPIIIVEVSTCKNMLVATAVPSKDVMKQ